MPDWDALFSPTAPLLELLLRGTVVYLVVVVLVRLAGQREAGGLGITDLLVIVLVAEAASGGLVGEATSLSDALVVVATIMAWSLIIDAIAYRSPRFSRIVKASPRMLVRDGEVNRSVLRRELMTDQELRVQLRLHGMQDLSEVKHVYLEPNGLVSVVPAGQENSEKDTEAAEDRPPTVS